MVVGGRGQLAKSFIDYCSNSAQGIELVIIDHRNYLNDTSRLPMAIIEHNPNSVLYFPAISNEMVINLNEDYAKKINSEHAIRISRKCRQHFIQFICFSTTKVFNEKVGQYSDHERYSFDSTYGRMKSEMEVGVLNNHGTVLRISKILDYEYSLWRKWRNDLNSGKGIDVHSKYFIAPVTLNNVDTAIWKLISLKLTGIFQLSNKYEVSFETIFDLYTDIFNLQKNKLVENNLVNFLDKPVRHASLLSSAIFDDPIANSDLVVLDSLKKARYLLK